MDSLDQIKVYIKNLLHRYAVQGKVAVAVAVLRLVYLMKINLTAQQPPFSKFLRDLANNKVYSIHTEGRDVLRIGLGGGMDERAYRVEIPPVVDRGALWKQLQSKPGLFLSTSVSSRIADASLRLVYTVSPFLYLGMLYYFMNGMLRGGGDMGGSTQNPTGSSSVKLGDVAGLSKDAQQTLTDVLTAIRDTDGLYEAAGARRPRGILLYGPAGCGKTLIARAMAGEAKLPFFVASASDFVEMLVGRGASRVRKLFADAEACAPSIVFIDEIDALAKSRGGLNSNDEREQTLNQLLTELDGFDSRSRQVLVLAATNRPETLDVALLRAGRFDLHVRIALPDEAGRRGVLGVHVRKVALAPEVTPAVLDSLLTSLAAKTERWTGADLALLVNEAAFVAVRQGRGRVVADDFQQAHGKVTASRMEMLV